MATDIAVTIPDGYTLHTENTSHILLPSTNEAFLNPVQEFNRDISVACITIWSEELNKDREAKLKSRQSKRVSADCSAKKRHKDVPARSGSVVETKIESCSITDLEGVVQNVDDKIQTFAQVEPRYRPHKVVILEALSATGLRSIRYAKEIPLVKYIIANDLSSSAIAAMERNVEINGLGPSSDPEGAVKSTVPKPFDKKTSDGKSKFGMVRINEGDACALMYNHRGEKNRVDVVDLDPYGTAAPFIDAAVQCINDGGLLCVTCTDLSVLATTNYPEKCYSNYGGIPVKAEYCHEAALRLVLHSVSMSAARYGRYIQPLLSLSIDFYVRLFIRIQSAPIEVKKVASKTSMYYICTGCQAFYDQPLGKMTEKVHEPSGNVNINFKTHSGPTVPEKCPECHSALHIAGPMWSGPIHNVEFVTGVLNHLENNQDRYGTSLRMKGMLTVVKEEIDSPFYFTPSRIAGFFHCISPSLDDTASALLHAGHKVSRSHALPGSLKTSATRSEMYDIFRSWIKSHPVRMDKVSDTSPTHQLLAKESRIEHNFKRHPQSVTQSSKVKLVRYQQNPTSHWGPGTKAVSGKRKRESDDD